MLHCCMPGFSSARRCCLHWSGVFVIFQRSLTWFCELCTGSQRYPQLLRCHLRYVPQAATPKFDPESRFSSEHLSAEILLWSPICPDRNADSAAPKKRSVGDAAAGEITAKKATVSGVPPGSDKSTRATSAAAKTSSGRTPAAAVGKSRDTSTGKARSAGRKSTSVSPQKVRCCSGKTSQSAAKCAAHALVLLRIWPLGELREAN